MEYWGVKEYFIYSLLSVQKKCCVWVYVEREREEKNEQEKNCDKMLIFEFAQYQYHSQWGLSKAWLLLIENVNIWEFWVKVILFGYSWNFFYKSQNVGTVNFINSTLVNIKIYKYFCYSRGVIVR